MSFKDDLHRHREASRQQRLDNEQRQANMAKAHQQKTEDERTRSQRIRDDVVFPLLKEFAAEYNLPASAARNVSEPRDGQATKRCSLDFGDTGNGTFLVSVAIARDVIRCEVRHSRTLNMDGAQLIHEGHLNCAGKSDGTTLAECIEMQLLQAATTIDEKRAN
jgi:hypothetical protein